MPAGIPEDEEGDGMERLCGQQGIFSGEFIGEIAGGGSRRLISSVVSMAALFPVLGGSITGEADSMADSTGRFGRSEDLFGAPGGEEFLLVSRNFSFLRASLFRSLGDFLLKVRPGPRLAAPAGPNS